MMRAFAAQLKSVPKGKASLEDPSTTNGARALSTVLQGLWQYYSQVSPHRLFLYVVLVKRVVVGVVAQTVGRGLWSPEGLWCFRIDVREATYNTTATCLSKPLPGMYVVVTDLRVAKRFVPANTLLLLCGELGSLLECVERWRKRLHYEENKYPPNHERLRLGVTVVESLQYLTSVVFLLSGRMFAYRWTQFSEEVVSARTLVRKSIEKKLKEEAKLAK